MQNQAMGSTYLLTILSYMLIISSNISPTAGQVMCLFDNGNFTTNSIYDQNLNIILSSLVSNITAAANGGFYNATIGQDPDKIYALAFCNGKFSTEACAGCVNGAIQGIRTQCPNQREAYSWVTGGSTVDIPPCTVRYANRFFFGILEMNPKYSASAPSDITSNVTEFKQIWESLMDQMVKKATKVSSGPMFATEEANLTLFQEIYAMVECLPGLSQQDCYQCLRQCVADYQNCCVVKQGGAVSRPSCYFRWDLYAFYHLGIGDTPSPSPPAAPSTRQQLTNTTSTKDNGGIASKTVVFIVVSTMISFSTLATFTYVIVKRQRKKPKQDIRNVDYEIETAESLQFDFNSIRVATNNFSIDNKLGQGGFGTVYKGTLPDGQDIAVKRLSRGSGQGEVEFKTEVQLVARLQHRNLVRLHGFCFEGTERLLIYEFVPNSSLDNFIFDPTKCLLLDWEMRNKIIGGIARGMLYLHEDSRWRIIHRDLKASNILLDTNMIPKIADFGLARLFEMDQTQGDTSRIVGTFGYMAPEYLRHGRFSIKSDTFSFGVLVLEIISGKRNNDFYNEEETRNLLTYAWKNWTEGTTLNLIDPKLRGDSTSEIMRCIHVGLLCVQENEANRPNMASVVQMLTSRSLSIAMPSKPAFLLHATTEQENLVVNVYDGSRINSVNFTVNEASISELHPR